MRCPKYLCGCSNQQQYHSDCLSLRFYSFLPSSDGLSISSNDGIPRTGTFANICRSTSRHVPNIPMFCLSLRNSTNCQPSCISKHSYMHNHAFYMFMHLIKLSCHSYAFAFLIPMWISVKINHVNSKCLLSCQFQKSTVLF